MRDPLEYNESKLTQLESDSKPGPKTPEGKARSAQNSTKHGFTASTFAVVRLEDAQEIAHLKDDLISARQLSGTLRLRLSFC